jgi:undecaprenyl pyrophosphate phosphatase UppP
LEPAPLQEKKMKKSTQLKILNVLLGLLMLSQVLSGLLHDRLAEETFEHVHVLGGLLIVIGVILHLVLNWGWVRMNYLRKPKGD